MAAVLRVLEQLGRPVDIDAAWARLQLPLAALSLDEIVELDYRVRLDEGDRRQAPSAWLRRRVVEYLLQRKLTAFVYECFDPFVNPWALEVLHARRAPRRDENGRVVGYGSRRTVVRPGGG